MPFDPYEYDKQMNKPAFDPYEYDKVHGTVTPVETPASTEPSLIDTLQAYAGTAAKAGMHYLNSAVKFANENLPGPEDPTIIKEGLSGLTQKAEGLTDLNQLIPPEKQKFGQKFTSGLVSVVPLLLTGPAGGATAVISAYQDQYDKAKGEGLSSPSSFFHGLIGGAVTAAMIASGGAGKTLSGTLGKAAVAGPGLAIAEPLAQKGLAALEGSYVPEGQDNPYERYASEIGLKEIFDPTNIGVATALTFGFGVPHYVKANREADLANVVYQAAIKDGMATKNPEKFSDLEQQVRKAVAGRPQEDDFRKLQAGEEVDLTNRQFGLKESPPVEKNKEVEVDSILNNMALVVDAPPRTEDKESLSKKPRVRKTKTPAPIETPTEVPTTIPEQGGIPKISPEEAAIAKQEVVKELSMMGKDDPNRPAREIQLEQYNSIINGESQYKDFQPTQIEPESVTPVETPASIEVKPEVTKSITSIDNVQNSHISTSTEPDSSMPYRLTVDGPVGTEATKENVKSITIDPDIWANETMLSKLKADLPALKEKYPNAEFTFVDSRNEGEPIEILKTKSIGNKTLAKIKKTFGATEDVQPRVERSNITTEEKVARLLLKDKEAVKLMAKNNPEILAKLKKDAGQKVSKVEKTMKGEEPTEPTFKIQQDVWYKGFKDGDTVVSRDRSKVERELPGSEIVVGKMDGTNFIPNETKIVSENEQSVLKDLTDLVSNERGSFSWKDKPKEEIQKQISEEDDKAQEVWGKYYDAETNKESSERLKSLWDAAQEQENKVVQLRQQVNAKDLEIQIQSKEQQLKSIETNKNYNWQDWEADTRVTNLQEAKQEISFLKERLSSLLNKITEQRGSFSTKDKVASKEELDRQKKVKTDLRRQYVYAKAFAESIGTDVKSYLLGKGMSEEQFNKFSKLVNADKGFTNPQMGHYLRNALGWDEPTYKDFKTKMTGIESMKDMNSEQQKKVLDAMQQLHFMEKGSEYKPKGRGSKKLVQMDIEKAIYEQEMSWKNGWGLFSVLDNMIASAEQHLGKWPAGAELVRLVKQRELNATLRSASIIKDFRNLTKDMSTEEMQKAVHVHLGEVTSNSVKVNALAKFINDSLSPYGQEMENLGVKIANPLTGKLEAFKFEPDTPYWPREYDWEDIQNPGRMRDLAVRKIAEKYKVSNAVATQKLNSIIRNVRKGPGSFGHLEISRIADLPNFNDNPTEVLPSYLYNAARRLEYIKEFGQDDVKLAEHLANIATQGGNDASVYAAAIVRRAFGTNEYVNPTIRAVINFANSAEVLMKLGMAQISNATQSINTYMHTNLGTMYKGMARLINPMTRAEAVDFAHNAGATFHTMVDAYSEYRRDPTTLVTWLRNTVPKGEKIFTEPGMAGNFLKYTGFTQVEIFNRVLTAVVGREYVKEQVNLARLNQTGRAGKLAEIRLQKLGLDPTELRTRELTNDDLYQGSNQLVEKTQFRNWALSLPKWTGDSAYSRLLTQFHSFAFHQTKMVKNLWLTEPERILPSLIALSAAGLIAGSAKDLLKLRERKWDSTSDTVKNLIYFLGQAGGFGMTADALQSAVQDKTGALTYAAGPVLGDISEYMYGVGQVFNGKPEILGKKMLRDTPVVGPTVANIIKNNQ